MAKINQFGGLPGTALGDSRNCLPFEAMLADAIDGTLSAGEQQIFDEHLATCDGCQAMLADARRGLTWLETLRLDVPEPPADLLERIYAQTSVLHTQQQEAERAQRRAASEAASLLGSPSLPVASPAVLEATPSKVLPFRARFQAQLKFARATVLQTRFAMTAAMAFFSVALTLNLTGVRLSELHASDLRPASMRRGLYEAQAHLVRYYANLRVVYELESRVRDLQRSNEGDAAPVSPQQAEPKPAPAADPKSGEKPPAPGKPKASSGTSHWDVPRRTEQGTASRQVAAELPEPATVVSLPGVSRRPQKEGSV